MTKKQKGSKSDSSKGKKRSQATSSASSSASHIVTPSADEFVKDEEVTDNTVEHIEDNLGNSTAVEMVSDPAGLSDEPTLTELIILKVEGEKVNGQFEGFVVAYFVNGNVYEGTFSEGTMHGEGKFHWVKEKTLYEGDFCYNELSGKGKYNWADGSYYEGDVLRGIRHGHGIYIHPSGKKYIGGWVNGKRNGRGQMFYDNEDQSFYDGEWKDNVIEGTGLRCYPSGNIYEGDWYKGRRHGQGTMRWINQNERYIGQWKEGMQHGLGQHTWYVQRIKGSQYSMQNIYDGEFRNGKRHGYGAFLYPNGSRYEGNWIDNKKCGQGTFIFKNGKKFSGYFEDDRIRNLERTLSRQNSFDGNMESVIQEEIENMDSSRFMGEAKSKYSGFELNVAAILSDERIKNPIEEAIQIEKNVLLHLAKLRKIYQFYSILGVGAASSDNTAVLNQLRFWRLLKDCRLHYERDGPTIAYLDRVVVKSDNSIPLHYPMNEMILQEFINYLIWISFDLYSTEYFKDLEICITGQILSSCFNQFMLDRLLPNACCVQGSLFADENRTQFAMNYALVLFDIYQKFCYPRKDFPHDLSMKMRDCLIILKKLNLVNGHLTAKHIVDIFNKDNPNVSDGQFVCLEFEITFYEFFELMLEISGKFISKEVVEEFIKSAKSPNDMDEGDGQHAGAAVQGSSATGGGNLGDGSGVNTAELEDGFSRPASGEPSDSTTAAIGGAVATTGAGAGKPYSSKPVSSKTKFSSADSTNNTKSRKADTEKSAGSKKPHKNTKATKPQATSKTGRRSSRDESLAAKSVEPDVIVTDTADQEETDKKLDTSANSPIEDKSTVDPPMNEETQLHFWMHQVHIFLSEHLFPNAQAYINLSRRIQEKDLQSTNQHSTSEPIQTNEMTTTEEEDPSQNHNFGFMNRKVSQVDDPNKDLSIILELTTDFESKELSTVQ